MCFRPVYSDKIKCYNRWTSLSSVLCMQPDKWRSLIILQTSVPVSSDWFGFGMDDILWLLAVRRNIQVQREYEWKQSLSNARTCINNQIKSIYCYKNFFSRWKLLNAEGFLISYKALHLRNSPMQVLTKLWWHSWSAISSMPCTSAMTQMLLSRASYASYSVSYEMKQVLPCRP